MVDECTSPPVEDLPQVDKFTAPWVDQLQASNSLCYLRANERPQFFILNYRRTYGRTYIWTLQLIDRIGPVGRFGEKRLYSYRLGLVGTESTVHHPAPAQGPGFRCSHYQSPCLGGPGQHTDGPTYSRSFQARISYYRHRTKT